MNKVQVEVEIDGTRLADIDSTNFEVFLDYLHRQIITSINDEHKEVSQYDVSESKGISWWSPLCGES